MGISPIYPPKVSRFIYDNEDILLELDGSNNIAARYTHGPSIDEPLIMEKGGASFFYHADGLGSITEITDSAGVVKQRYTYSSFGKIESQLDPNFVQPYTFTSREFDPETGLYHHRIRTLDPSTGRFNQEDPVLRAGDPHVPYLLPSLLGHSQTLPPYVYVANDPVSLVDPFGLFTVSIGVKVTGGVGVGAGGGTFINFGFSRNAGFTLSVTGTAEGGGLAGSAFSLQGVLQIRNLESVCRLTGRFVSAGKSFGAGFVGGGDILFTESGKPVGFDAFFGKGFRFGNRISSPLATTGFLSTTSTLFGFSSRTGFFGPSDR